MNKSKKEVSRALGLEVGSICGKYFLKLDHLHYGYWTPELEVDITNLHIAQDQYTKFIISHIPKGVKMILDVGCGTGQIANELLNAGYKVDCVSPCPYLKKKAGELLGDRSHIFECYFEDLDTTKKYDLVMFCESFQYVKLAKALSNTQKFLNSNSYLLISDFFKKDVEGKSTLGGGHDLSRFHKLIEKTPFKLIENVDITENTAPNMDLYNDVLEKVIAPVVDAGERFIQSRYPVALKLLKWKYRKKIAKAQRKYMEGGRTGKDFKKFKSYQLFVYKKNNKQ